MTERKKRLKVCLEKVGLRIVEVTYYCNERKLHYNSWICWIKGPNKCKNVDRLQCNTFQLSRSSPNTRNNKEPLILQRTKTTNQE